ncbi:MAG: hypothetical protein N2C14_29200, partial [Planctomycetales bacterium]
ALRGVRFRIPIKGTIHKPKPSLANAGDLNADNLGENGLDAVLQILNGDQGDVGDLLDDVLRGVRDRREQGGSLLDRIRRRRAEPSRAEPPPRP